MRTRQVRWLIAVPLALLSGSALIAASIPRNQPQCAVAKKWVANHLSSLPHTLREFDAYPQVYRRAIYAKLSGKQRVGLWREHLAPLLAEQSKLNSGQKAFLRDVLEHLSDYVTDPTGVSSRRAISERGLDKRAHALFTRAEFRIFDIIRSTNTAATARGHSLQSVSNVETTDTPFCECDSSEPFDPHCGDLQCETPQGTDSCFGTFEPTCGFFNDSPCDGLCYLGSD